MQRLRRTLEVAAWAAFFALAATVLVLRYAVLPHIERLRPEIVERVSAIVGQRVTIGGIEAPRLVVRRDAAGALYIAGIKLVPTPGEPGLSDWLSTQRDIEVRNAEIE